MCDVLVLDDEALIREFIAEVLADEGLAVCEAETVHAARQMLREHGTRLLVADKNLHESEDGHALAREAMRLYPGLLVLYISGRWEALRDLALTPRERVLPKPFTAAKLVKVTHELIGQGAGGDCPQARPHRVASCSSFAATNRSRPASAPAMAAPSPATTNSHPAPLQSPLQSCSTPTSSGPNAAIV